MLSDLYQQEWLIKRRISRLHDTYVKRSLPKIVLETNVLFVHIPKVAGISLSEALYGKEIGHRRMIDYQNINSEQTREIFKFTFVRHPVERFISAYNFLKTGGINYYKQDRYMSNIINSKYADIESFLIKYIEKRSLFNTIHFAPQHSFLENNRGEMDIDFIGKFENFTQDIGSLKRLSGVNFSLKKKNVGKLSKEKVNDSVYNKIIRLYQRDCELFGYS